MKQKHIMILGAGSHVGKTTLVAGLCRMFANQGLNVVPFKSQNMSLNSFVTLDGKEIARSTAVQAFAAKHEPSVHMNPILLKPKNDMESQIIFHGKVFAEAKAEDYFFCKNWHEKKLEIIKSSLDILKNSSDLIVAEGAGSCAEPNFQDNDLVNMGIARLLNADVYLVVDIDKGGIFADILGTLKVLELTSPQDIPLIKGIFINKFRGSKEILQPALDFLSKHTPIPIVGIIPYFTDLYLEEEDRVKSCPCENPEIDIAILYLPHIANASDFNSLAGEKNVRVRFVRSPECLGCPDLIIIPGTKSTIWDLNYIRSIGWEEKIKESLPTTPVMGICGGFEMLGKYLHDPQKIESDLISIHGLGLLDLTTFFKSQKIVTQASYQPTVHNPFKDCGKILGYEIHCGTIEYGENIKPLFYSNFTEEGAFSTNPFVFGTFIHDIFKNAAFTRSVINFLRQKKGLSELTAPLIDYQEDVEKQFDALAAELKQNTNIGLT